jgi:hypothetical protein
MWSSIQSTIRPCVVAVVSHHVLILVHWSSVLGLALFLFEQKQFMVSKLGLYCFYLPFSGITLFVLS